VFTGTDVDGDLVQLDGMALDEIDVLDANLYTRLLGRYVEPAERTEDSVAAFSNYI
jgi:hypothetical protein